VAPQGGAGARGRAEARRLDRRWAPRSPSQSARHDEISVVVIVALGALPVVAVIVRLVTSQDA